MKIGIYGGAFNPPHFGHLIITNYILHEFKLDFIYFIPSYHSGHKQINVDSEKRLHMLKLSLKNNNSFCINTCEIKAKKISYTIDTLKNICSPKNQYYLIIGNEWLPQFNTWKDYKKIFNFCSLIVAHRISKENKIPLFLRSFKNKIFFSNNPLIEISSSKIQEMIKKNRDIRYFVSTEVYRYIQKEKLYKK